jgi:putative transposase
MNQFTTDLVQALVQKEDVTEIFRSHLENAVNTLLASELTAFLDYEKYDRIGFNTGNSRNGSYERTLHTEFGELHLVIPRDRNGDFKQQTVAPYKRANDTLEAFVIHMFQKGVTTAEIAHLMERMYGHHYTPQTISNMTKVMSEQVEAFRDRTLCARYACVYLDATYIALKRDTVSKEAVYIAVGIREDGSKEVLGYTIAPNESAFVWKELLEDIKSRGVEEILLFISDGLKGISDSVFSFYPASSYQTCCVHLSRTIAHKVRVSDRATSNLCTVQKALKWANRPYIRLLKSGSQSTQKLQSHCSITLICSRFIAFLSLFGAVFIRPISLNLLINKSRNIVSVRNNSQTKSHLNASSFPNLTSIISDLLQDVTLVLIKLAQSYK